MLLDRTFGPKYFVDGRVFGTLQLRTSPNAGARHEIECYVIAINVSGVPRGVYHYNNMEHCLELLEADVDRARLSKMLYAQPMVETAPLLVMTSAVIERISYKYRDGRAYRLWMYNVGHVGQTFALVCTALGLGAFQTAAFHDSMADEFLGLDSRAEFVTYALGCGRVEDLEWPADLTAATTDSSHSPTIPSIGESSSS